MTITFRAAGAAVTSVGATTLAPVVPAGAQVGDLLVLSIGVSTATAQTFTGLTGWTQQKNLNVNSPVLAIYTKVAVLADIGATLAPAWTTSAGCAAAVVAYAGVDSTIGAIDASGSGNDTLSTTVNYGSLTAPLNNMLLAIGALASGTTVGIPASFTQRINNTGQVGLGVCEHAVTAGATGGITSTAGSSPNNQGVLLALRPAQVPSFREAGTGVAVTPGTSVAPAQPPSTQIGDLLLAICSSTSTVTTWTGPGGWTQIGATQNGQAIFYRFAAAAGSGTTHTFTCSSGTNSAKIIAYAGVGSVDASSASAFTTQTSVVHPSLTSLGANRVLLAVGSWAANAAGTPNAGMVKQLDAAVSTARQYISDEAVPTSGTATGTRTTTISVSSGLQGSILLAPPTNVATVRGVAKNATAAATSLAATLPPDQANGDVCVVTVAWINNPGAVTDPGNGWTVVESDMTGTNGEWFKAYMKTTGVSEAAPTITWVNSIAASTTATCIVGAASLDIDGHTITASSTTINWPSVTPAQNPDLLLFIAHADSASSAPVMPVGTTTIVDDITSHTAAVAWEMQASAAATGARTGSGILATGDNTGYVIALSAASAPNADTLTSPTNGGFADVSGGVTFQSTYNATDGANANAYALRAKQAGGSYVYWNAGTSLWQGTIVWNALSTAPGASRSIAVPASATITNGVTLNWSMASQESLASLQGPFASDFSIVMQAAPTVSVTAPSGTITTLTPTVQWTTTPGAGTSQISYRVVVYNPAQYGGGGFTPGVTAGDYDSGVLSGAAASLAIPGGVLVAGVAYRFYVQVTETGPESSTWQFTSATVALDPPADPTITATPGTDGTTGAPRTAVTVQGRDNLMSLAATSFEDGTTGGWTAGASTTIANSTAQALNGTHSLALTRITSIGTASASTPTGAAGFACTPGQQITAIVNFRAAATGRACSFQILWYKAGGAASTVRASDTSSNVNDVTTGWTPATLTVVAPSDAVTFAIVANAGNALAAINEVHYIDEIDLGPGASTVWTRGGLSGLTTAVVQFSDDSGVTWANLRTSGATIPWPAQAVTLYDYEAPPGAVRTYRAQVQANVGAIIASNVVSTTATGTTPTQWVVSDPTDPTSGLLFHATSAPQRTLVERETIHAPLGRGKQVRVSDGPKGWAGRLQVRTLSTSQESALEALVARNVTLLVQSPEGGGRQWYANVSGDPSVSQNERTLGANVLGGVAGRGTTRMPHSDVTLTYAEAERP